jgi:hypothetical protein
MNAQVNSIDPGFPTPHALNTFDITFDGRLSARRK